MKPADIAWVVLFGAVLAYEVAATTRRDWELLSEACDRYRHKHPVITLGAIGLLAGHLSRAIPRRFDPLHRIATWR